MRAIVVPVYPTFTALFKTEFIVVPAIGTVIDFRRVAKTREFNNKH
jgi:hypothetical protein